MRAIVMLFLIASIVHIFGPRAAAEQPNAMPDWNDHHTRLLRVREAGMVRVSWDMLAESGWELATISAHHVQIWRQGQQIPIQVTANGIAFRAEPNTSRFTTESTYWLGIGSAAGLRTLLPAAPTSALIWEVDRVYQSIAPTERGDHWFAAELRTGGTNLEVPLNLPVALPIASEIEVALTAIEPGVEHILNIHTGNTHIAQISWREASTLSPQRVVLSTKAVLPAGAVTLNLSLASSRPDLALIDSLTIPAAQITLPTLTPALEQLRALPPMRAADQLIIAHPDFIPALAPLVAFKQQQGRAVAIVDVLAIYDSYNWGERDPEAIRDYIQEFVGMRSIASVLLVGAGTSRMRLNPGELDATRIPPYLINGDPVYGEIACDTCYTRLQEPVAAFRESYESRVDTLLPALAIGRLPARSVAEAEVLVAKTLAALHAIPGDWQDRVLLVADNDYDNAGVADPAGPFTPLVAAAAANLNAMQIERFIYAPEQPSSIGSYQHAAELRSRLLPAWDAGTGLIMYAGHASPWQWAWTGPAESVPHIFNRGDAVRTNTSKLPILLSMTCLSGSFQNPTLTTVDQELLTQPGGGIAAALSPTGSGVNTGHAALLHGVIPALLNGETLGAAHLAGLRLLAEHADPALAYSYGILGDPDIRLAGATQQSWMVALPMVAK